MGVPTVLRYYLITSAFRPLSVSCKNFLHLIVSFHKARFTVGGMVVLSTTSKNLEGLIGMVIGWRSRIVGSGGGCYKSLGGSLSLRRQCKLIFGYHWY